MTQLATVPAPERGHPPNPDQPLAAAARLAARIPVPVQLPCRLDGQRLEHLSASSYRLFVECPEAWRRRYIAGERSPKNAGMVIGSRVDDALTDYYRHQLQHGEQLPAEEVLDRYQQRWSDLLQQDAERDQIIFDEFDEHTARQIGAAALAEALGQLVPQLGEPVAMQRRVEFPLAPGLQWTILGYLDLETRQPQIDGSEAEVVVDYKVKGANALSQIKADRDPQASLYLAVRWREGQPATRFTFAQVLRQNAKRKTTSTAQTHTERTAGQHRATLARFALAASQIVAAYQAFGPERPWGFAEPGHWRCSAKYCAAYQFCAGGSGL
jgi:hypothetical protein